IALTRGRKRPEQVHIVRSAPDTTRFRPVEPDPALREGRRYLVAYVGVMGKQEGIDLLLDAVRVITHEHGREDILFVLIGSGPERPHMEEYAKRIGVAPHVRFTGRI
ncbi:MAG: glycosyltransferase WbuB, partial [Candidatus Thermofonsia Clade 3 bacterium]